MMPFQYLLTEYDPDTKTLRQFWLSASALDNVSNVQKRPFLEIPVNNETPLDDESARRVGASVLMSLVSQYPELRPLALVTDGHGRRLIDAADGRKSEDTSD
ncbi:MAG: hypothetical protein M3O74_04320 [Pseudomonadota bacterium]|uniref:hypothetical protein n=1 Tax=Burkholderia sp. PAMC 28687 TaxID=1795874 RepID=UPI00078085A7|nr:hypothetical protein [Burkholderia sp. PAMC 28687]AMM17428.1 hypothetical protein AX768_24765 [Burkholderia sp. PAMC 28687]MDP9153457.1 hypothetical protein [Pseudomonadota bacterium]